MLQQSWLCTACGQSEASLFCFCNGSETFLCGNCLSSHFIKNPTRYHQNLPVAAYGQHRIPGYFERLQSRSCSIPKGREAALKNIAVVDECMQQFVLKLEGMIERIKVYGQRTYERLERIRSDFEREINESLSEIERTMHDDSPNFQSVLAKSIRNFTEEQDMLTLFTYQMDVRPFPSSLDGILTFNCGLPAAQSVPVISAPKPTPTPTRPASSPQPPSTSPHPIIPPQTTPPATQPNKPAAVPQPPKPDAGPAQPPKPAAWSVQPPKPDAGPAQPPKPAAWSVQPPKPATGPAQPPNPATGPAQPPKPATGPAQPPKPATGPAQLPKPATGPAQPPKPATGPAQPPKPATVSTQPPKPAAGTTQPTLSHPSAVPTGLQPSSDPARTINLTTPQPAQSSILHPPPPQSSGTPTLPASQSSQSPSIQSSKPRLFGITGNTLKIYDLITGTHQERTVACSFSPETVFCLIDEEKIIAIGGKELPKIVTLMNIRHPTLLLPGSYMSIGRAWPGVIKAGIFVYVFGGNTPSITACEKFSISARVWRDIRPMHNPRYAFSPCEYQGEIYLLDSSQSHKTVEAFNPSTEQFRMIGLSISVLIGNSVSFVADDELIVITSGRQLARARLTVPNPAFIVKSLAFTETDSGLSNMPPTRVGREMFWPRCNTGNVTKFHLLTEKITEW